MPPILTPYVIAVDPGKKTGYAIYDTVNNRLVDCGEGQFDQTCDWLEHYCTHLAGHFTMVTERFVITVKTARNSQAPWSLEMIGVCRRLSHKYMDGKDPVMQEPASAKRFVSNQRLHDIDWWQVGTEGHVNDALRHLMLFLASFGWWDERLTV